MPICKNDGAEKAKLILAGVEGDVCLKCGEWTTDASLSPEVYVQVLEAYNKSRGLEKDRAYKLTLVGPGQLGAITVPEEDLSARHKHCLGCGLNFHPPRARADEPFCSQICARRGWTKQYPPAGVRQAFTQPMPIVPASP
jgi:hypothetical protein